MTPMILSSATIVCAARLAAVGRAEIVETIAHVHIEAVNRAEMLDRKLDATLIGQSQEGDVAGDGVEGSNLHCGAGLHDDCAERPVTEVVAVIAGGSGRLVVSAGRGEQCHHREQAEVVCVVFPYSLQYRVCLDRGEQ